MFRIKKIQMSTEVLQVRRVCCVLRCFSCVWLCESWTIAHQAPLSSEYSRQNIGLPWALLQGIFLIQGLNLGLWSFLHWQVSSLPLAPPGKPIYLQTWGVFKKFLADFWSGFRSAVLLFSHKRGADSSENSISFWVKGMWIYFPLMCPPKGKMTYFHFL